MDREITGFTWSLGAPANRLPWQADGESVELLADGTLRARKVGSFVAIARKSDVVVRAGGVVLPKGWSMKLLPENATIAVGEPVSFSVRVVDTNGNHLPGIGFSVFPAIEPAILRGPGLVASATSVTFSAVAPGRTVVTAYLGDRKLQTGLTVLASDSPPRPENGQ
jgi:hypothetical protein